MKYLTTTEIGEIWGISPRRVALLASQGRIKNCQRVGNSWLIPENALKPTDNRRKDIKAVPEDEDQFVFPFLLACVHSEEQINNFAPEEAELYDLCLCFETGDFQKTRGIAETLLNHSNPYVRIGALYHLPTTCMYLGDFAATDKYYSLFKQEINNATEHKAELNLLKIELDFELLGCSGFTKEMESCDIHPLPDYVLPLFACYKFSAEFIKLGTDKFSIDVSYHELNCRIMEAQGYFFAAMYMHVCLSSYYGYINEDEKEKMHIKQAIAIGLEHNICFTLAYTLSYNSDSASSILSEYPPEVGERFREYAGVFVRARNAYSVYRGKTTVLARLTDDDYRLLTYCSKQLRVEDIAEIFGLSRSGMNRRLSVLYKKLGVSSRNETVRLYKNSVLDWGR